MLYGFVKLAQAQKCVRHDDLNLGLRMLGRVIIHQMHSVSGSLVCVCELTVCTVKYAPPFVMLEPVHQAVFIALPHVVLTSRVDEFQLSDSFR